MRNSVQDCFAQGIKRGLGGLLAQDSLVGNFGLGILGTQQVDGSIYLIEQVSLDNVLVGQIGCRSEVTDLYERAREELPGIGMKKQHGCALKVLALAQMQQFD